MEDKELLDIFLKCVSDSEARLSAQISELKTDWQNHNHPDIIKLKQAHVDAEKSNRKLWVMVSVVSAIISSVSTLAARILIK
jgi:hypothetical protein